MAFHGKVWRLTWRDIDGTIHWTNSGTDDPVAAQRQLAELSLPRAQAMVRALTEIIDGAPYQKEETAAAGRSKTRGAGEHKAGRGSVRHNAAVGRDRGTTRRGGKR